MKENICSIPINDIFGAYHDCPFCYMRNMIEEHLALYITGAAMMQPDVRIATNAEGFCKTHFDMIIKKGNRLSVALILQSLLDSVGHEFFDEKKSLREKRVSAVTRSESCFLCSNVENQMIHLLSCLISEWEKESEFRQVYKNQKGICTAHYSMIIANTHKKHKEFLSVSGELAKKHMKKIKDDIDKFCNLFDYRNKNAKTDEIKNAIENAVENLTARPVKNSKEDKK